MRFDTLRCEAVTIAKAGAGALILTGLIGFVGCGKVPTTHFYTLEAPSVSASSKTLPYDIAVARFRTAFRLSQDRLVYMPTPYHVDYYNYHRWAGFPADMVTVDLISSLKHSKAFHSVTGMRSDGKPDYILRGEIENLEEQDNGSNVTAKVSLTLDAYDVATHNVVWSGAADYSKPVTAGSVEDVARELSDGVRQCLRQLTDDLIAKFPEKKEKNAP